MADPNIRVTFRTVLNGRDISRLSGTPWHSDHIRCRIGIALYGLSRRIGRWADRIDSPRSHPR